MKALKDDPRGGNRSWTINLKLLLANFGSERYALSSEYSDKTQGISEFLIDFLWWDRRDVTRQQMVLAVESEWYNVRDYLAEASKLYAEEVAKDFYKLMLVKSPYKLMTFSSKGGESRDLILKKLEKDFSSYIGHTKNEHYLLLDSSPNGDWGAYELLVAEDGSCKQPFIPRKLEKRTSDT